MVSLKLALRNLLGAGLRTWLNVAVLSFAFVVIVFYNGMLDGWNQQAITDTQQWETGNGQLWHPLYDRYDMYSLQEAHGKMTNLMQTQIDSNLLTPVLITQATMYPQGRMLNVQLKGIDPAQTILAIPAYRLQKSEVELPAIIGKRMAKAARLSIGDQVLIRWRDKNGTFDAREVIIVDIFDANVPTIDNGQIWISLDQLQSMTGLSGEATLLVASKDYQGGNIGSWQFKNLDFLLKEFNQIMQSKKGSSTIIYGLLLAIALLAIFDTQVLSVFRRQKEIGTYIALGMTRLQVVQIFTIEGSLHSLLALALGGLYGVPLLAWIHQKGIPMPKSADDMGIAITDSIIPVYSLGMVITTILLVVISATIVSYFPARRIAKLKPTDALKGKIQ